MASKKQWGYIAVFALLASMQSTGGPAVTVGMMAGYAALGYVVVALYNYDPEPLLKKIAG